MTGILQPLNDSLGGQTHISRTFHEFVVFHIPDESYDVCDVALAIDTILKHSMVNDKIPVVSVDELGRTCNEA